MQLVIKNVHYHVNIANLLLVSFLNINYHVSSIFILGKILIGSNNVYNEDLGFMFSNDDPLNN